MAKSPGHREHPDHKVRESHVDKRMKLEMNGELVADSRDVIKVDEDGHPPRYYFPRGDVRMDKLSRSDKTTACPFKGTAHYFSVNAGGRTFPDAVWTYEEPYDEHKDLADRVAFYEKELPEIALRPE